MSATIVPPTERECERCGRRDRWDDETENWVIDGRRGSPTCIHEWDINGSYNPVAEST
ncbi:HEWD family protein [Halosegnis marinus]|uniref:HEWD family protein n=1 Tax=Halosegnis marinus TaxID=3034023 RepID=A0ABD5ZKB0_9EURY|nr:HEWD family protein [Halosegnis sp. DT85]